MIYRSILGLMRQTRPSIPTIAKTISKLPLSMLEQLLISRTISTLDLFCEGIITNQQHIDTEKDIDCAVDIYIKNTIRQTTRIMH